MFGNCLNMMKQTQERKKEEIEPTHQPTIQKNKNKTPPKKTNNKPKKKKQKPKTKTKPPPPPKKKKKKNETPPRPPPKKKKKNPAKKKKPLKKKTLKKKKKTCIGGFRLQKYCLRPYDIEYTTSHPNREVKLYTASIVLRWGTTREVLVL